MRIRHNESKIKLGILNLLYLALQGVQQSYLMSVRLLMFLRIELYLTNRQSEFNYSPTVYD